MPERGERDRKRRIRWWHVPVFILVALIVAFGIFRIVVRAKINNRLDAVRAAEYPVTTEELEAWYTIPPFADNAADYITVALSRMTTPTGDDANGIPLFSSKPLPSRHEPLDERTRSATAALLAENTEAMKLLNEGLSIPDCHYPVNLTQDNAMQDINLQGQRHTTRLLVLAAIVRADQGDPNAAVEMLLTSYKLAGTVDEIPMIITELVAQADRALTTQGLEQVINRTALTDNQLARIDAVLWEGYDPNSFVRALAGERCFGLSMAKNPAAYGPDNVSVNLAEILRGLGVVDLSLVRYLDRMAEAIEIAKRQPWERQKAMKAADARYESSGLAPALNWLSTSHARLVTLSLRGTANALVARVAVAVERYRLATGRLPQNLADLVPTYLETVPIDPFDGQPLRYKRRDPGYVVYSIGPDETDDNGTEYQGKPRGQREDLPYDVTFIVER